MTIDLLVGETLERKLADVRVPRVDIGAAREAGRRRRRRRNGVLAGVVFLAAFGTTAAVLAPSEPEPVPASTDFPALDFSAGLRGVYYEETGEVAVGGQVGTLDDAADLGTSAVTTPYGLIYFTDDQAVRLLGAGGQVSTIAPAPERPDSSFTPTVRYDDARQSVAWLTRSEGQVTLSAYSLPEPRMVGSFPVPCEESCGSLRMGGQDHGVAFVVGVNGTIAIDPSFGPGSTWVDITDGRVIDVRNFTILSLEPPGAEPVELPEELSEVWRLEPTTVEDGMLSSDASWEMESTDVEWRRLGDEPLPFKLAIPAGTGSIQVKQDTDGTVLVRRTDGGDDVFYDCDYFGNCAEFARFDGADGRSGIIGDLH